MSEGNRVVALIDMDCFYVQVEERANPHNRGKPGCVVQYKNWKGGGIIAVNYEARAKGVTRQMRGDEAREKCPDIILYRVPEQRGKADLTKYRDAGKEVIDVLWSFGVCIERASIDEAYLDMTSVVNNMLSEATNMAADPAELPNTHVVGYGSTSNDVDGRGVNCWLQSLSQSDCNEKSRKLYLAAMLCEKMRAAVYEKTGFRCSAGIACNKMLAKLACGIHKPNKQTVLPMESVGAFFKTFPLKKVRHLGGKLGETLRDEFNCASMEDIVNIPEKILQQRFDVKTGSWLYWYARGICHELVSSRRLPKSIGCNKNFTGTAALDTREKINHWLLELCTEVAERLEKDRETNQRTAKQLTLTVRLDGDIRPYSYTRSLPLPASYDKVRMANSCFLVMSKENPSKQSDVWNPVVTCLGVSASKFVDQVAGTNAKIDRFFTKRAPSTADTKAETEAPSESDDEQDDGLPLTVREEDEELSNESIPTEDGGTLQEAATVSASEQNDTPPLFGADPAASEATRLPDGHQAPKKSGFFASRNFKRKLEQPPSSFEKTAAVDEEEPFPIEELFPDLDNIDMDTVSLLPLPLQRKLHRILEARTTHNASSSDDRRHLTRCDKCGKEFIKEEIGEHMDWHMASELQKEMSAVPSASTSGVAVAMPPRPANGSNKSTKRQLTRPKKSSGNESKRTRTIQSFFRSES